MLWQDLLNITLPENSDGHVQTELECPECGRKIYMNNTIILTGYPAKYSYWCSCGWNGFAHVKWTKGMEGRK